MRELCSVFDVVLSARDTDDDTFVLKELMIALAAKGVLTCK